MRNEWGFPETRKKTHWVVCFYLGVLFGIAITILVLGVIL